MSATPASPEILVAPTTPYDRVLPASQVRGSMLSASLALVRERDLEAAYFAKLEPRYHDDMRSAEPLSWLPMELGTAHYRVMNALFPSFDEQVANGRLTAERTLNVYVRTIVRALQASKQLDPAMVLKRLPMATERSIAGGGAVAAYQTGPKDARAELVGFPFLAVPYARNGWQGLFEGSLSLAARRLFVRQDPKFARDDRVAFLISWV